MKTTLTIVNNTYFQSEIGEPLMETSSFETSFETDMVQPVIFTKLLEVGCPHSLSKHWLDSVSVLCLSHLGCPQDVYPSEEEKLVLANTLIHVRFNFNLLATLAINQSLHLPLAPSVDLSNIVLESTEKTYYRLALFPGGAPK